MNIYGIMLVTLVLGYLVLFAGQVSNANRIRELEEKVFEDDEDVWKDNEGDEHARTEER